MVPDTLDELEDEAIYIIREAVAELENLALLFSGGKDSAVLLDLAYKALWPLGLTFPVIHIDTGHNFPEVLRYRDDTIKRYGAKLIVGSVEETINKGAAKEPPDGTRNALQAVTLVEVIENLSLDGVFGGARRDEEKARAKERIFSFRDSFSQWNPRRQRPELWSLYNTFKHPTEHFRIFPLSNWTELDVYLYIKKYSLEIPPIYFAHERKVFQKNGNWVPVSEFFPIPKDAVVETKSVRFRTVGDMTCTAAIESQAKTIDEIISEVQTTTISERGQTRLDDQRSQFSMEDRKAAGYF